jgi:tetratricopeptide (TPR) repeat protein
MEFWNTLKFSLLMLAVVAFSACQQLVLVKPVAEPEPVAESSAQAQPPEPAPPPDNLPPSRRVREALQLLEQGEYEYARKQLGWALQEKPGLQIAQNLIEQIDADPIDYLGVKNFYYQVESGESLSIIAGKFLDDPMKFVVLARYNHLHNPSKLAPGDRIRVPGEMPDRMWKRSKKKHKPRKAKTASQEADDSRPSAETAQSQAAAQTAPAAGQAARDAAGDGVPTRLAPIATALPRPQAQRPQPSLDEVLDNAKRLHALGDLPAAIYQLEKEGSRFANTKAVQSLQIAYYREYAAALTQQGDLPRARGILEKLVLLDASDEQAINDLIRVEDKLEARKLYQQGNDQLANGAALEAYQSFTQALTYDPDNSLAKQAQLKSRDQVTDEYHRQAMRHFRKQELGKAIALWDKILLLDPEHPLAPGYKARAMEMKQKLQRIESKQ